MEITLIFKKDTMSIMRKYVGILCSVLLMAMVLFPGCTTQDTIHPATTPAPPVVNTTPPVTTPAPWIENMHLPIAPPTPQVVYVTVTVPVPSLTPYATPVPSQTTDTVPVPALTSGQTVCNGSEQTASGIRMTGTVYGLASDPEDGIDEIRFTLGLDSCSPALDLTQLQIAFSTPNAPAVTLSQGTRTSTGFFTTKIGTAKVTFMNPGDQVEIAFFVAPVPANTRMNIELKTPGGATVPFTMTAPARISARNILS
jgi:archaellin